jgi:hypothetical protein
MANNNAEASRQLISSAPARAAATRQLVNHTLAVISDIRLLLGRTRPVRGSSASGAGLKVAGVDFVAESGGGAGVRLSTSEVSPGA